MAVDWDVTPVWAAERPPEPPRRRARTAVLVGLAVLVVLGGVALLAEQQLRRSVEGHIEDQLRASGVTGVVDARLGGSGWRPSALLALVGAEMDRVEVRVREGSIGGVPVVEADYVLRGLDVTVDVSVPAVTVHRIGDGTVRLLLDPVALGASIGQDLVVDAGEVLLGPDRMPARVLLRDEFVVVAPRPPAGRLAVLTVPAVDPYLLPCRPDLRILDDTIELSCSGDDLPGVLAGPLGPPPVPGDESIPPELPPPQTLIAPGE
jgi:hypothetical protein